MSIPVLYDCDTTLGLPRKETEMLVVAPAREGPCIHVPARILDEQRFKAILFGAWRNQSVEAREHGFSDRQG